MNRRIFVLGNAVLDETFRVPHLPEIGETVVATRREEAPGGKGLNQAVVAARAGAGVRFAAAIGEDMAAERLRSAMAQERRLAVEWLPKPMSTDRSVILVGTDGANCIVSAGACADSVTETEAERFAAAAGPGDLLLMQGNLGLPATRAAIAASRAPVLLNVAPVRWPIADLLRLCQVLVVNRIEAQGITGHDDPVAAALAMLRAGVSVAIVTLGADGCLLGEGGMVRRLPVEPVTAVDTSGAGDAFCGTLAAARLAGHDWTEAVGAAQRAASLVVQRPGCFASFLGSEEMGRASA